MCVRNVPYLESAFWVQNGAYVVTYIVGSNERRRDNYRDGCSDCHYWLGNLFFFFPLLLFLTFARIRMLLLFVGYLKVSTYMHGSQPMEYPQKHNYCFMRILI